MGWKGTLRSLETAHNQYQKQKQREEKAQQREFERHLKKLEKIEEKKEKVKVALNNDYASGKVSDEQYQELSLRLNKIPDELIVFGKTAGVTLAKRYACGKIDQEEFEKKCKDFVPTGFYSERKTIFDDISSRQSSIEHFKQSCEVVDKVCHKCGKKKGFFSPLRSVDGMSLCGRCSSEYKNIKSFPGFHGQYLNTGTCEVCDNMSVLISINKEWL